MTHKKTVREPCRAVGRRHAKGRSTLGSNIRSADLGDNGLRIQGRSARIPRIEENEQGEEDFQSVLRLARNFLYYLFPRPRVADRLRIISDGRRRDAIPQRRWIRSRSPFAASLSLFLSSAINLIKAENVEPSSRLFAISFRTSRVLARDIATQCFIPIAPDCVNDRSSSFPDALRDDEFTASV